MSGGARFLLRWRHLWTNMDVRQMFLCLLASKETNVTNVPMDLTQMVVQNVYRTTTGWIAVMYSNSYCPHSKLKGNDSLGTSSVIQGNRYPHRPGHNTFPFLPLFLSAYPTGQDTTPSPSYPCSCQHTPTGQDTTPSPSYPCSFQHTPTGQDTTPFPSYPCSFQHTPTGQDTTPSPSYPCSCQRYPHRSGHNTFPFLPLFLSAYAHRSGHNTFPFLPLFPFSIPPQVRTQHLPTLVPFSIPHNRGPVL